MTRHEAINILRLYARQCRLRNVVEAMSLATNDMAMADAEEKSRRFYEEQSTEETQQPESDTEQAKVIEKTE